MPIDVLNMMPLLLLLADSVEDLIIANITFFQKEHFGELTQMFLPKLKKCALEKVEIYHWLPSFTITQPPPIDNVPYSLEALKFKNFSADSLLPYFAGCTQLKSFEHDRSECPAQSLVNFLAQQSHLKKLAFKCSDFNIWSVFTCSHLEELTTSYRKDSDDNEAASISEFLKKQVTLKKLDIKFFNLPPRRLLKAICDAPKLEDLHIQVCSESASNNETLRGGGLQNNTVKKLKIKDNSGAVGKSS